MEKLTPAALPKCFLEISQVLHNATSSLALEAGLSPSNLQSGPMTDLFGQVLAPAKVSAARARENEAYACAAAVLPACSIAAPHKRDRLFFVADCDSERLQRRQQERQGQRVKALPSPQIWGDLSAPFVCSSANGISNRVGKLRGYGNAIVPALAAEFIKASI